MTPSPAADLTALTAAITKGFADVVVAVEASKGAVDLAPLTAEVKRMTDALYTTVPGALPTDPVVTKSLAQVTLAGNDQVDSVIGTDKDGHGRVRTNPGLME